MSVLHNQLARVAIVGTSCAGKTTLARALSATLNTPHIELDELHWGPNWTPQPAEAFCSSVDHHTSAPRWVCDGNYHVVREYVWGRATAILWLDYSFPVVFSRALRRTITRTFVRAPVCNGNYESFRLSFLSRDSILLWVLRSHWQRKVDYQQISADPRYRHLQVIQLSSPRRTTKFLASLRQRGP